MIALLTLATALATEPLPDHVELDAILGMRVGASALYTVEPVRHVETGGWLTVTTDVYAGAPGWVRDGLDPTWNLHAAPMGVFGVNTGRTPVSLALLGAVGAEVTTFREVRTLPALDEPVVYGATGIRFSGGLALDLRVRPKNKVGGNLQLFLPLPFMPTGAPDVTRIHAGLGVTF